MPNSSRGCLNRPTSLLAVSVLMPLAFAFSCAESHVNRVIYLHRPIVIDSFRINRVHRPCFIPLNHEPPIILHDHLP